MNQGITISANFTAAQLKTGCQRALALIHSPQYAPILAPYARVSRHNLDTGFSVPLAAALQAGAEHSAKDLAAVTEDMATAATEAAAGFSGMRLSWALQSFASACEGKDELTPVALAEAIRQIIEQMPAALPSSSPRQLHPSDVALTGRSSITAEDVFTMLSYSLLAAVSLPEQGSEDTDFLRDSAAATEDAYLSLEPDLVAFLMISLGLALGAQPAISDSDLMDSANEVLSRLPSVSRPAPITMRAQRLNFCILTIEGAAGVLAEYRQQTRSKDVIWAVGKTDFFGWETWKLVHRVSDPVSEVPDFAKRRNLVVVSPPPVGELSLGTEQDPTRSAGNSNVVTLHKPASRVAHRPTVIALTRCQDTVRDLPPMGVNVLFNPDSTERLKRLLESVTDVPITILTSDPASVALVKEVLSNYVGSSEMPILHAECESEVALLHAARHACAYNRGADPESRYQLAHNALEQAEATMRSFTTKDPFLRDIPDLKLSGEEVDSQSGWLMRDTVRGGFLVDDDYSRLNNLLVQLPATMDPIDFQTLEASLPKLAGVNADIHYYQGNQADTIIIVQTW
ncbi:DAK2 domain-containing protein [Boudabousia marimammalium]|uniref:DhaL domain-containing protein n=1 Tax=Boudabousia marimammalium TaxID=156892 RepID=A0A1Q5PRQ9_9ACTO|nr:DAK2 domain-containing protein [Boudabousia marimammalium]OKL50122.1 hypothetical protein BM477_01600 [Boudabousia marimammalium]